jgi:hypothetical protein
MTVEFRYGTTRETLTRVTPMPPRMGEEVLIGGRAYTVEAVAFDVGSAVPIGLVILTLPAPTKPAPPVPDPGEDPRDPFAGMDMSYVDEAEFEARQADRDT